MIDLLLLLLILLIPAIAQIGITSNYNKYKQVANERKISGQEVARQILDANGLEKVYVVETSGNLSDHYDPSRKVVRLSSDIFHGETVAAVSVAAHECGHAIQHKEGYIMMRIRSMLYPIVRIGTMFSYIVIAIGVVLQAFDLVMAGIALTGLGLLFQIVTLPVEFDASKRALSILENNGYVSPDEHIGCKKMLTSAAMTYVAGVLASALQILRLVLAFTRNRD